MSVCSVHASEQFLEAGCLRVVHMCCETLAPAMLACPMCVIVYACVCAIPSLGCQLSPTHAGRRLQAPFPRHRRMCCRLLTPVGSTQDSLPPCVKRRTRCCIKASLLICATYVPHMCLAGTQQLFANRCQQLRPGPSSTLCCTGLRQQTKPGLSSVWGRMLGCEFVFPPAGGGNTAAVCRQLQYVLLVY